MINYVIDVGTNHYIIRKRELALTLIIDNYKYLTIVSRTQFLLSVTANEVDVQRVPLNLRIGIFVVVLDTRVVFAIESSSEKDPQNFTIKKGSERKVTGIKNGMLYFEYQFLSRPRIVSYFYNYFSCDNFMFLNLESL